MAFDIMQLLRGIPNMLTQPGQPQPSPNMLTQQGPMNLAVGGSMPMPQQPQMPAPQPQQQQGGGFMDKVRGFTQSPIGQNLQNAMLGWAQGGTMQDSIGKGAQMIALGRQSRQGDAQKNQTIEWLKSKGMDEQQANAVAGNPAVLTDVLKNMLGGTKPIEINGQLVDPNSLEVLGDYRTNEDSKPTSAMQEYEYAVKTGAFKGSFTDWQTKGVREQDPTFSREKELRGQYDNDPNVKNYKIVRDNYERIRTGATAGTGAGDISVIFGYMKMLDPTSVVRENEQATAQNAGGVPAHIRNLYNKTMNGDLLPPESRAQIVQQADAIYKQAAGNLGDTNTRYGGIAERYQLDGTGVIQMPEEYEPLSIGQPQGAPDGLPQPPAETPAAPPAPGQIVDGFRYKGGNPADPNSWEKVQ